MAHQHPSNIPHAQRLTKPWLTLTVILIGAAMAFGLDLRILAVMERVPEIVEIQDWYRLLRIVGYVPTWIVVAVAMILVLGFKAADSNHGYSGYHRGFFVVLSALLGGVGAAIFKVVFRRLRYDNADGAWYAFRPISERTIDGGGLSLPSEHTAVAFGAAFAMCVLMPRARWLWIMLAVGCGCTRVLTQDHYPSDVYVAAVLSWCVVHFLTHQWFFPSKQLQSEVISSDES